MRKRVSLDKTVSRLLDPVLLRVPELRNLVSKVPIQQLGKLLKARQVSLVLILVMVSATLFGFTVIQVSSLAQPKTIHSSGQIMTIGVGIYWDKNLTNRVSSLDWGVLEAGSNRDITVYIRNEGNTATILTMNSTNWNPPNATSYMTLTWNYSDQRIDVGESIMTALTLSVSGDIQGITGFSFDIILRGTS